MTCTCTQEWWETDPRSHKPGCPTNTIYERLTTFTANDWAAKREAEQFIDAKILMQALYTKFPYHNWTANAWINVELVVAEYNRLMAESKK